jgi:hypothetical protein
MYRRGLRQEARNAKRGIQHFKWLRVGKTKGLLDGWLRNYPNAAKDEAAYRYETVHNDSSDPNGNRYGLRKEIEHVGCAGVGGTQISQ